MNGLNYKFITRLGLALPVWRGEPTPCPYLPDRLATPLFSLAECPNSHTYQQLMDIGFRRSGQIVYANHCNSCRECIPIRVPVEQFHRSKSQRRAWRNNADLRVEIERPTCDGQRVELYNRYQQHIHSAESASLKQYEMFLGAGPDFSLEFSFWLEDQLVGISIVDECPACLSSVYFYYEPALSHRGLGTFSALREIEECRFRGLPYWYSGYYVRGCAKMKYKADFRPFELLHEDGCWRKANP